MRMDATSKNDYFGRLLTALFEFMRRSGFTNESILEVALGAVKPERTYRRTSFASATDLVAAGNVLDRWRSDRKYMDRSAHPRAVRLRGPAPSVEALVKLERRAHKGSLHPEQMKALGLVSHAGGGKYKPSVPYEILRDLDAATQHQIAHALFMMLQTIAHNIATPDKSKRLIERFAEIPDLPRKHRSEFRDFARQQGHTFIQTINRWLAARRVRKSHARRKATVAGVHVYAYLGNPPPRKRKHVKRLRDTQSVHH
jgi:hypothetical protein